MDINIGDKVIIKEDRYGMAGLPCVVRDYNNNKYMLADMHGDYVGWYFPDELMPDKPVLLSYIFEKLWNIEEENDDLSDYEYMGWQNACSCLRDKLFKE